MDLGMTEPDRLRLRARVKADEGFRNQLYRDTEGNLTIGYGRLMEKSRGGGISQDEGEYMLTNDLRTSERLCEGMPGYEDLSPARQAVLVNMCFNLGAAKLREFKKMFAALTRQAYEEAAFEMIDSKWAKQVGQRANRLAWQMKTGQWWSENSG